MLPGIERIPRARRIRTRKVNMIRIVKTSVDGEDLRDGNRECLPFAAIAAVVSCCWRGFSKGKLEAEFEARPGALQEEERDLERERSRGQVFARQFFDPM